MFIIGKNDPPLAKATKADIQRDKDLDAALFDQPSLPSHLQDHERRTLREDIDVKPRSCCC
jgi:cell cycle checkpoint protein